MLEGLAAPDTQRRGGRTWLDFSPADVERLDAYERVCQSDPALAAWLGFRLYVPLYSPLEELLFSLRMNLVNTLLFLMLFLAVVLPICLALGSRFGKWLAGHLDF